MARLLVRRGARKLVLMGIQAYPARAEWSGILSDAGQSPGNQARIKRIMELEAYGACIDIFSGSLTDTARLQSFIGNIRQQRGEIGGVIHCAGSSLNKHPAFVHKSISEIKQVFEPKVEAMSSSSRCSLGMNWNSSFYSLPFQPWPHCWLRVLVITVPPTIIWTCMHSASTPWATRIISRFSGRAGRR